MRRANPYPKPIYKRIATDDRAFVARDLRSRYDAGASIRDLCADTGRSYGIVHKLLTEAGTVFRTRGGRGPRPRM